MRPAVAFSVSPSIRQSAMRNSLGERPNAVRISSRMSADRIEDGGECPGTSGT